MSISELAARLGLPVEQVAAWPAGRAPRTTIAGVHLVVGSREADEAYQDLCDDTAGITNTDRCPSDWPAEEPTQPHATCDTLPPPEDSHV